MESGLLKVIQPVVGRAGARAQDSGLSLSLLTDFHGQVSALLHWLLEARGVHSSEHPCCMSFLKSSACCAAWWDQVTPNVLSPFFFHFPAQKHSRAQCGLSFPKHSR